MAAIFGDAGLFEEFDKQRPPSDKILNQKLGDKFWTHGTIGISNGSHVLSVCNTEKTEYEHWCYPDNDTADCDESMNLVNISKLRHLENEVHRLTVLNIFLTIQSEYIGHCPYHKWCRCNNL